MKNWIKKIICLCIFIILCIAYATISYAESSSKNDVYVYFTDDGKTLHFTNDKNKGSLIDTQENCFMWYKDRYDLFEKEIYTTNKGEERTKVKVDDVKKIVIDKKITPLSCNYLFSFPNLNKIEKLKNLDTSNVKDFSYMFMGCKNLENIDLSNFNFNQIENAECMFTGCEKLNKINFKETNGNGNNLKNINWMFNGCKNLKEVDFSNLNLNGILEVECCFYECENLEHVNFGKNEPYLKELNSMFYGCKKIESIDLSSFFWNYNNIESLSSVFDGCINLNEIKFPEHYTNWEKLENIKGAFNSCEKLEKIYIGDEKISLEDFVLKLCEIDLNENNILNYIDIDYSYNNYEEYRYLDGREYKLHGDNYPEADVRIKSKNNNYMFKDVTFNIAIRGSDNWIPKPNYEYISSKPIKLSVDGYANKSYYIASNHEEYTDEYKIVDVAGKVYKLGFD